MYGISIDSPAQHAAMIEKLGLPFPLLSDPDRSAAIQPYGAADERDPREIARPVLVVVAPDGEEAFRIEARDFADRPPEDGVVERVQALGLPPTSQGPPEVGPAEPGPKAMSVKALLPYYRGARFAAVALGRRHPAIADETERYVAQMDRYHEAMSTRR